MVSYFVYIFFCPISGFIAFFICLVVGASAFYGPGDDVVELTPSNFHQKVINGDELWIIEFYAPW